MLKAIKCGKNILKFNRTLIMGILNVTPDSFSDGNLFFDAGKAVEHAKQMAEDGADIIDVGGESTRPGSDAVSEKEELRRVSPIIKKLAGEVNVPISIDTYKPRVAEECIKLGASIINDTNGLRNKKMIEVAAKYKIPVIIMHMKGIPKTMQKNPEYMNVINEIKQFLAKQIKEARKAGIADIIVDPGIGFGKATEHNLKILKNLSKFKGLKCPILVGASRKSFIGNVTGLSVDERMEGTLAAASIAIMSGANIVRVHDVKECKRAVMVADAVRDA